MFDRIVHTSKTSINCESFDGEYFFTLGYWNINQIDELRPALFAIKLNYGTQKVEVHILSADSDYKEFLLHAAVDIIPSSTQKFVLGRWLQDSRSTDLYVIYPGSNYYEMKIFYGNQNFQSCIANHVTDIPLNSQGWHWTSANWDGDKISDLFAINQINTSSGMTEAYLLPGVGFYAHSLPIITSMPGNTDDSRYWYFGTTDWNGDKLTDLVAVKKKNTGTKKTEIHVLSGSGPNIFQNYLWEAPIGYVETDDKWDFALADWDVDGSPELFVIQRKGTSSGFVEITVLK